jgi:hypothetical protein
MGYSKQPIKASDKEDVPMIKRLVLISLLLTSASMIMASESRKSLRGDWDCIVSYCGPTPSKDCATSAAFYCLQGRTDLDQPVTNPGPDPLPPARHPTIACGDNPTPECLAQNDGKKL